MANRSSSAWILGIGLVFFPLGASAQQLPCSADLWMPPAPTDSASVKTILDKIPASTKWADLPETTKSRLRELAEERLATHRARWSANALRRKQNILLDCPTKEMTLAINDYYRKGYDSIVPKDFSMDGLKSSQLKRLLVRHYLGAIAAQRSNLIYPGGKLPNRDWDGKSLFDSTWLPEEKTNDEIREMNMQLVLDLRKVDDKTLTDLEKAIRDEVLYSARSNASIEFDALYVGDPTSNTACGRITGFWSVLAGYETEKQRPPNFANDDEVLRELNAIYLPNDETRWLDKGTVESALKYCISPSLERRLEKHVGDIATDDVAKGMMLLMNWWIERVLATDDARDKCSIYSELDRRNIWERFSAYMVFNNDGSSPMEDYRTMREAHTEKKKADYRDAARTARDLVFPDDDILKPAQRSKVTEMIESEQAFGLFPEKIAMALDAVQDNDSMAMQTWRAA